MDRLDQAATLVGYANRARYEFRGKFVFQGIALSGAHVLEVGCGTGPWAIWAALNGASKVVGIEPEASGSSEDTLATFRTNVEILGLHNQVEGHGYLLEDLPVPDRLFDVVVMYNVINHLDEKAVIVLHKDTYAFDRYVELLKKLRTYIHSEGWVIVADSGRDNIWPQLGLRSPFVPSIEWEKHQNPQTWIEVFRQAGYRCVDLRWSPLQPFPGLTGNRLVEYLTCSHFVLRFRPEELVLRKDHEVLRQAVS